MLREVLALLMKSRWSPIVSARPRRPRRAPASPCPLLGAGLSKGPWADLLPRWLLEEGPCSATGPLEATLALPWGFPGAGVTDQPPALGPVWPGWETVAQGQGQEAYSRRQGTDVPPASSSVGWLRKGLGERVGYMRSWGGPWTRGISVLKRAAPELSPLCPQEPAVGCDPTSQE